MGLDEASDTPCVAPDQKARLTLDGVEVRYGDFTALHKLDLSVQPGEFLSLLGPSGSGKSTLLNVISGATAPSTGGVLIDGRDVTHVPPQGRGLGMVFQSYALLPHLTVFENVAFPLRIRKWPKPQIASAVTDILQRVGLGALHDRKPAQLSGGQQQRVGIARCLVYSPAIVLMDEPLGALDKNMRAQMQEEIKALHRDTGVTFIYVTHDQEEALNLSDRICLMNAGRIEQCASPHDLYFQPKSVFVASFLGESNIIPGCLAEGGRFVSDDNMAFDVDAYGHFDAGQRGSLVIRPEHIRIADALSAQDNIVSCKIEAVTFVGGGVRATARAQGGQKLRFTAGVSSRHREIRVGDDIGLTWNPADTILLSS